MEAAFGTLGRALLFSGVVPAMLWIVLQVLLFWRPELAMSERIRLLIDPGVLAGQTIWLLIASALTCGALLFGLNRAVIRSYEGSAPLLRTLLAVARRRNLARHKEL